MSEENRFYEGQLFARLYQPQNALTSVGGMIYAGEGHEAVTVTKIVCVLEGDQAGWSHWFNVYAGDRLVDKINGAYVTSAMPMIEQGKGG